MKKLITLLSALALTATFSSATFARTPEEIQKTNAWTDYLNTQTAQSVRDGEANGTTQWYVLTRDGRMTPVADILTIIPNKGERNKDTGDANKVMPAQ
ncbi:MAG: hypothetical protein H6745_01805 [Deltaproteobacteria bacterium]|nr:hypothetical protein [Deltaproteobacteria bacterium]